MTTCGWGAGVCSLRFVVAHLRRSPFVGCSVLHLYMLIRDVSVGCDAIGKGSALLPATTGVRGIWVVGATSRKTFALWGPSPLVILQVRICLKSSVLRGGLRSA